MAEKKVLLVGWIQEQKEFLVHWKLAVQKKKAAGENGAIGSQELFGMIAAEADAAAGTLTEEAAGIQLKMETGILSRK